MVKLKISQESGIDDTQTINSDIKELSNQYIGPIDRLRSLSKPTGNSAAASTSRETTTQSTVAKSSFEGIEINTERSLESRAHCFYRMLGLPVMDKTGSFYNPGFDPLAIGTLQKREKVNQAIINDQNLVNIFNLREIEVQNRRNVFVKQDINSTAYALVLRYTRSFSEFFDKNTIGADPLALDSQRYTIKDRTVALANFNGNTNDFKDATHILRPFVVNPSIADTIIPSENMICVPFLPNKEATKIDITKNLLRPGIEFICRLRLQTDNDANRAFVDEVKRLINGDLTDDSESVQDVKNTILAIAGVDDLNVLRGNSSFLNSINSFTNIQIQTLNMLIKTIKSVIFQLDHSIRYLDTLSTQINFQPIPNIDGPEFGGSIRVIGGGKALSQFEQKIGLLKILDLNAQRQQKVISDKLGGGNELFASAVVAVSQRNYNDEISKITRERDELSSYAINSLSNIERICGEVSGLGLIDVLAIYTALWAIDIDTLIGFLDDSSFDRMVKFNPELITTEVQSRKSGNKVNGLDVLKQFEIKLFNILSFVDRVYDQMRSSPADFFSGNVS
jgi:hypothetical protein